jgi:hypothetical protein
MNIVANIRQARVKMMKKKLRKMTGRRLRR